MYATMCGDGFIRGILKVQGLLVIIPTLNERDNIVEQIRRVKAVSPGVHVLVVDDGSVDETVQQVTQLMISVNGLHLLEREGQRGLGLAYKQGFAFALAHGYDVIAQMDGDLSHNPDFLTPMVDALENADFAIGSRYVAGGSARYRSGSRVWLSRAANALLRAKFKVPFKDLTTGLTCIRGEALKRLDLNQIQSHGFGFQFELKILLWRLGFRGCEVPIRFEPRLKGASKLRIRDVFEAARQLTILRSP